MATKQQFDDAMNLLNTATSAAGAKIVELRDKLAAGGLTPAEEQAVLDQIGEVATSLNGMAQDPSNPVPIPVPEPTPPA
jgi:HAMP domain-containing protein